MKHLIGAQTIVWGETIRDNLAGILQFLSAHGYSGAETGMRHFDAARPDYYRKLYKETGMVPLGLHSGGQFWLPDAAEEERWKLWAAVDFAKAVGFRWMVISGNKAETVESMRKAAETYGQIGRRCREAGFGFAYHNHDWELADNAAILDTLMACTDPSDVSLVLDVAWAHIGGLSLAGLLDRYAGRIAYLHVKDVKDGKFCELGTGEMDLPAVCDLAGTQGVEWLVVEQDYTDLSPEESMRRNRQFLAGCEGGSRSGFQRGVE